MILRPYQLQAHEAVRETWQDHAGALLVMATGTGKTLTGLSLAVADFLAAGHRVVWLAHRKELLDQPLAAMRRHWPEYTAGIVQGSRHAPEAQIVFASVQTLAVSPGRVAEVLAHGAPALCVVDEAHHAIAPSHLSAITSLGAPLRLGLTATPHRDDGGDLSEHWTIAYSFQIDAAIRDGFLLPPYAVVDRVPDLNLEAVSGRWDYDDAELGAELLRAGVVEHTVAAMGRPHTFRRMLGDSTHEGAARGRQALVFTATVEQARLTSEALCADGWQARYLHGGTPQADRDRMIAAFRKGKIDAICNASVLTEGTDLPTASVVVLARPTRSWSLYVQMLGRALRPADGQDLALVLDLAGASEVHSLISAPVLIGGSPCRRSESGVHAFAPTTNGRGKCDHCGTTIACFANLGAHTWGADCLCSGCGRAKCPESPTRDHAWLSKADHKRQCLYCGCEVADPLAGMVSRKRAPNAVEGDWVRIDGVWPHVAAVDVGEFGALFVRWEDPAAGFEPIWLRRGARKPQPLSDRPVPREYVRAYGDDLVTRAARVAAVDAGWKRAYPTSAAQSYGLRYGVAWKGETAGEYSRRVFAVRARERAVAVGICEERR